MTREEVAKACGLEPPIEYIKRTGGGHTTAMLCDAVSLARFGHPVFILAFRTSYAQRLAAEARQMARKCGVRNASFEPRSFEWENDGGLRAVRSAVVLRDHYNPR